MNRAIAYILMAQLMELPYIQRFAGLVSTQEQPDTIGGTEEMPGVRRILKKYPVAEDWCITKDGCQPVGLLDMTPDASFFGQLYFEDNGIETTKREGKYTHWKSRLRLVMWLNRDMIVTADTFERLPKHKVMATVFGKVHKIFKSIENSNDGYFQRLRVKERNVPITDANIFSKYTFDNSVMQYLMPPYEFFALDLDVEYRVNTNCVMDLAVSLANLGCGCYDSPVPAQYPALNALLPYRVVLRVGIDTNTGHIITPNNDLLDLTKVEILSDISLGGVNFQDVPIVNNGQSWDFTDSAGEVTEGLITLLVRKKIV